MPNFAQQWLNQAANNRWVVLAGLVGVLALLLAVVVHLGGQHPPLEPLRPVPPARTEVALLEKSEALVAGLSQLQLQPGTNYNAGPFFTDYFKPPPPPPPPPPLKVALLYQGCWESSDGRRQAFLKVGENLQILSAGASITGGFHLVEFTLQGATLQRTNQTNVLRFNQPVEIEIPAQ